MKKILFGFLVILSLLQVCRVECFARYFQNHAIRDTLTKKGQNVRIMFYNVENLYDPYDDTTTLDNEFTPSGTKHWNYNRFSRKLQHLSKTIMSLGGWKLPSVIGFCEIENRYVLNKLIYETPLKKFGYRFIQYESPDLRGVDVALLYRSAEFLPLTSKKISIIFPWDTSIMTRDILYVKGLIFKTDTIHLFVNHWPSRRGGQAASQPRRNFVASELKKITDSIYCSNPFSQIVIMGDFNDEPSCESLKDVLGAREKPGPEPNGLLNMMFRFEGSGTGSHKFQGHWGVLDQFIVSWSMLSDTSVFTTMEDVHIYRGDFLSEEDEKFFGTRPSRTYAGPRYLDGFSDHLPVWLDIWKKQ